MRDSPSQQDGLLHDPQIIRPISAQYGQPGYSWASPISPRAADRLDSAPSSPGCCRAKARVACHALDETRSSIMRNRSSGWCEHRAVTTSTELTAIFQSSAQGLLRWAQRVYVPCGFMCRLPLIEGPVRPQVTPLVPTSVGAHASGTRCPASPSTTSHGRYQPRSRHLVRDSLLKGLDRYAKTRARSWAWTFRIERIDGDRLEK